MSLFDEINMAERLKQALQRIEEERRAWRERVKEIYQIAVDGNTLGNQGLFDNKAFTHIKTLASSMLDDTPEEHHFTDEEWEAITKPEEPECPFTPGETVMVWDKYSDGELIHLDIFEEYNQGEKYAYGCKNNVWEHAVPVEDWVKAGCPIYGPVEVPE